MKCPRDGEFQPCIGEECALAINTPLGYQCSVKRIAIMLSVIAYKNHPKPFNPEREKVAETDDD